MCIGIIVDLSFLMSFIFKVFLMELLEHGVDMVGCRFKVQ